MTRIWAGSFPEQAAIVHRCHSQEAGSDAYRMTELTATSVAAKAKPGRVRPGQLLRLMQGGVFPAWSAAPPPAVECHADGGGGDSAGADATELAHHHGSSIGEELSAELALLLGTVGPCSCSFLEPDGIDMATSTSTGAALLARPTGQGQPAVPMLIFASEPIGVYRVWALVVARHDEITGLERQAASLLEEELHRVTVRSAAAAAAAAAGNGMPMGRSGRFGGARGAGECVCVCV